jgi:hypothetical protein
VAALLACSDEQWVLDEATPLLRNQIACGFDAEREPRDAVQGRLEPGQQFTVKRSVSVEGHTCWFVRTPDGLQGWIVSNAGRAHRAP